MVPLGMILAWAGYGLGSWGYVLVKGYNITLREWFSPLHPFTGTLASAGTVPQGQLFPGKAGSGAAGSNTGAAPLKPGQTSQTGQGSGNPTESRF